MTYCSFVQSHTPLDERDPLYTIYTHQDVDNFTVVGEEKNLTIYVCYERDSMAVMISTYHVVILLVVPVAAMIYAYSGVIVVLWKSIENFPLLSKLHNVCVIYFLFHNIYTCIYNVKITWRIKKSEFTFCRWTKKVHYPLITYCWTVPLILDHSYLVGKLTSSKIADTTVSGF